MTQTRQEVRKVTVTAGEDGQRIDNFLLKQLPGVPKSHVYRLLRSGQVRVDGGRAKPERKLVLRAVDGYAVTLTRAQARARDFIVATSMDGKPMALGGLGPLWAIYDADRAPDMAGKPLPERFATCPWALYHIEVA